MPPLTLKVKGGRRISIAPHPRHQRKLANLALTSPKASHVFDVLYSCMVSLQFRVDNVPGIVLEGSLAHRVDRSGS